MVFLGENNAINTDSLASTLARTWYLPMKEEVTEYGLCLPELVEKDLTYFLLGALAAPPLEKIDSLRKVRPRNSLHDVLKIIFSSLCPKFVRTKGRSKILYAGNPKSFLPLMTATGGIYFDKILSVSWFEEFKRAGICQRSRFDYFRFEDVYRAFKMKVRLKKLWRRIQSGNGIDDRLRPAVGYLLTRHFPELTYHLFATERMLQREKPDWVLVDEDRTEEKRMLIALAKKRGIQSAVFMHGAPTRWIGFAPLFADYFITWGEAYIPRLVEWGIPQNRILVGGSPLHEQIKKDFKGREQELKDRYGIPPSKKVMLLALNIYRGKPSEDLQGQSISEGQMKMAFDAAVACLSDGFLVVKPHPRDPNKNKVKEWVRDCRNPHIIYSEGDIFELICLSDFVLSPGSTVLLDAVYFRKKAVVLDFFHLPWFDYMEEGLFFRAKDRGELDSILRCRHTVEDSAVGRYFADRPMERILNFFDGFPR